MTQVNLDLFSSHRRDLGMARAADHADRVEPGWTETALDLLRSFLVAHPAAFLAEEFRAWASGQLSAPPDARAFGAVMTAAKKLGMVEFVGYAPANSSNRSPKCRWVGK
jgi:hypothetical protein